MPEHDPRFHFAGDLVDQAEQAARAEKQNKIEQLAEKYATDAIDAASTDHDRFCNQEKAEAKLWINPNDAFAVENQIVILEKAKVYIKVKLDARKTFKGAGVDIQKRDSVVAKMFGGTLPDQIIDSTDKK